MLVSSAPSWAYFPFGLYCYHFSFAHSSIPTPPFPFSLNSKLSPSPSLDPEHMCCHPPSCHPRSCLPPLHHPSPRATLSLRGFVSIISSTHPTTTSVTPLHHHFCILLQFFLGVWDGDLVWEGAGGVAARRGGKGWGLGMFWFDRRGLQGRIGERTMKIWFSCYTIYNRIIFLLFFSPPIHQWKQNFVVYIGVKKLQQNHIFIIFYCFSSI